ncbi:MAG: Pr6Pr family membrane protein [Actinomycetota bacterium]
MQEATPITPTARRVFGAIAGAYWFSLSLGLVLTLFHVYPSLERNPHLIGYTDVSTFDRVVDFFSWFTIWSSILLAIVFTQLARGRFAPTMRNRVLLTDALLMVSVTCIIFQVLLRGLVPLQGLQVVTDAIEHAWGPVVAVIAWIVFGPRGWITWRTVLLALVLPLAWLGWTFLRSAAFIGLWPYTFLDVTEYGLASVLTTVGEIILFALFLGFVFLWIDRARPRGRLHLSDQV